ncbi:hypothetical protein DWG18_08865 [Lysobacter sp. TY2-98]|uniref:hypothetical protein n=1 Tax=Lysobacter sp. TY2-98 TaxID=2290922 RepID=UPI000E2071CE|nr:hypothetical protein [Lysobacter sp. TY2-98]AXK72372.1 hypothetical protein DWG18_08865 [Lysobacter sp. TY2-98]
MTEHTSGYAVFLFEQAWEALGDAIKPYVQEGPSGPHIPCHIVDTGGAFVEMTLPAKDENGAAAEVELMIPMAMVRMIVSMHSDIAFGFARSREPRQNALPVVGPNAPPAQESSAAMPHTAQSPAANAAIDDDRRRPPEG